MKIDDKRVAELSQEIAEVERLYPNWKGRFKSLAAAIQCHTVSQDAVIKNLRAEGVVLRRALEMTVLDLNGTVARATNMEWAEGKCTTERMIGQARAELAMGPAFRAPCPFCGAAPEYIDKLSQDSFVCGTMVLHKDRTSVVRRGGRCDKSKQPEGVILGRALEIACGVDMTCHPCFASDDCDHRISGEAPTQAECCSERIRVAIALAAPATKPLDEPNEDG